MPPEKLLSFKWFSLTFDVSLGNPFENMLINYYDEEITFICARTQKYLNTIKFNNGDSNDDKEPGMVAEFAKQNLWEKFIFGKLYLRENIWTRHCSNFVRLLNLENITKRLCLHMVALGER